MPISKKPYKGTRDFFPFEKRIQDFIFDKMTCTAQSFGYEHYDGPLLEEVELYKAKSGEELINDQIYSFTDRGERFVAIRPEMTPTLARMVAQIHREYPKPIRWFSIPNLLRYERPQRGRLREHWQFNCDIFGAPGKLGELEILLVVKELLESYGATNEHFEILLNDRTIVDAIFSKISDKQDIQYRLYKIVDKSKKVPRETLEKEIGELNLSTDSISLFFNYLDTTSFPQLVSLLEKQNLTDIASEFNQFINLTKSTGLDQYIKFDPAIVRGLDYYTGIVFEVFDKHPDNRRAICGGGAYAGLMQIFNEQPLPGVGFGLGDVTIKDFLDSHNLMPDLSKPTNDLLISFQNDSGFLDLASLASSLRKSGANVFMSLEPIKFNKVFKEADKRGAKFVLLFGDSEKEAGIVLIKNLETKEQKEFKLNDIEAIASEIL
jgi:histidyl-tRNA synthetase